MSNTNKDKNCIEYSFEHHCMILLSSHSDN